VELAIAINKQSTLPIFTQVSAAVRTLIEDGTLPAGARLPSTSDLGKRLSVNRLTVVKAYDELLATGYIVTRPGAGSFVSDRVQKRRQLIDSGAQAMTEASSEKLSDFAHTLLNQKLSHNSFSEMYKFNYGGSAADMLPGAVWKSLLINQCHDITLNNLESAPEAFGWYGCRKAISDYLCLTKGLRCSAEQILVFSGSQQPLNYLANILCRPGDIIAVEEPSYFGALNNATFEHADFCEIEVDDEGLIVSQLDKHCNAKFVYTTPSGQDPTGVIMSLERRKQLLNWAQNNDALIIEDGWDSDYCYTIPTLPAIQGLDQSGRTFYIYSFWKLLYPLLTISVLVVPPQFIEVFELVKTATEKQFSLLEQRTLAQFIEDGHLERHLRKTKRIYSNRRKALIDQLVQSLRDSVVIPKQSAGLHMTVNFDQKYSGDCLEEAAKAAALPFISTQAYYRKKAKPNQYMIPFALLDEDELRQRTAMFCKLVSSIG
jgi:GntR family transcriptional regulator/MocR family aminotransferase